MSYSSVNTAPNTSLKYNILWPEDLDTIKITEEERDLLQAKIEELRDELIPKSETYEPYTFCSRIPGSCPRRVLVNHDHYFVVLNTHGGMPKFDSTGAQQKKIKYVWECKSGRFWLKKAFFSFKQRDCIKYLQYAPNLGKSSLGIPKLVTDGGSEHTKRKLRYFEEMAELPLPKMLDQPECRLEFSYLVGLMDSVRKIHAVKYQPARFHYLRTPEKYTSFDTAHNLFHGDISPNNVICENIKDTKSGNTYSKLMLTDFYGLGDLENLYWTTGWASPECIQFAKTRTKYQEMNRSEFMAKYGAKKDTWAMGLIIGSLIRGGMHPKYKQNLPSFSFITDKLKFDSTGEYVIDESGLADITQEEIDSKIDALIEEESSEAIKVVWNTVKNYLVVNPDKRLTMAECNINIS
ncbi:MAG: hypothetical protein VX777_00890 [Chlamydiota bacterium]|nr:hypothetical protein [Chlamydiota bacterium]